MSNFGQASLSLIGASIGWVFSGGNPLGAAWGFSIGMSIGGAAFPTDLGTVNGPRLNDLQVQSSTVGAPIPLVYGTYAIAGNVIWSSGIIEKVSKKKQGGKGGPTQTVKTYSYSVNCAVGICEGPITGVRRVWADAKLIFDARPQFPDETNADYIARQFANGKFLDSATLYGGTEDQEPDPTIESYEGVGEVSAYRGLAYYVFSNFQLEDYGNRVPSFRFEVDGIACAPFAFSLENLSYAGPLDLGAMAGGTRIFITADGRNLVTTGSRYIQHYGFNTAWDIRTLRWRGRFDWYSIKPFVAASDVAVNADLTGMFVLSTAGLARLNVVVAGDISTSVDSGQSFRIGGSQAASRHLEASRDGTSFVLTGSATTSSGHSATYLPILSWSLPVGDPLFNNSSYNATKSWPDVSAGVGAFKWRSSLFAYVTYTNAAPDPDVTEFREFSFSSDYDINSASYIGIDQSIAFIGTNQPINDLEWNSDGTVAITGSNEITEYLRLRHWNLAASYDVTGMSEDASRMVTIGGHTGRTATWNSISISGDGLTLYALNRGSDRIFSFDTNVPFDFSAARPDHKSIVLTSIDTVPESIYLTPDGAHLYVVGSTGDRVYHMTLSTAGDIRTATLSDSRLLTTNIGQVGYAMGVWVSADGTRMFLSDTNSVTVTSWALSTPFIASSAALIATYDMTAVDAQPAAVSVSEDGTSIYVLGRANNSIYRFSMEEPFALSTVLLSETLNFSAYASGAAGFAISEDENVVVILSQSLMLQLFGG
jgi:sugar lactone lactonase YvrE